MSLPPEVFVEIAHFVRGGFEDRDSIVEILLQDLYDPGELDEALVTRAIDEALRKHEEHKRHWPAVTDCDRLESVFNDLNRQGIIALHNAGYTQSDGYDDVSQALAEHPAPDTVAGYCFYHGQDLERVLQGGGLLLSFGPLDPRAKATEGPRIGAKIADALRQAGFAVEWDGTFSKRIFLPDFDWKKR
ncbi:MAG: hypothetical protein QM569_00825 [Acidovorax sp.]|uniref:DUF6891 domain-containing protein n=1 Tax=Acidovorax sp. TaxID=1872122 RepID=UPI0039E4DA9D